MAEPKARWMTFYAENVEPVYKEIVSHIEKLIIGTLIVSAGAHVSSEEPSIQLFGYLRHSLVGRGVMLLGVIVLRPMLPREELFVMRSACGGDIRTLCAGVAPGGGRIMQCIANRAADLSPACKDVLVPFMAR